MVKNVGESLFGNTPPPLSESEKQQYIATACSWCAPLLKTVDETDWISCGMKKGVKLSKKMDANNPVLMVRGQAIIKNYSIQQALQSQKSVDTTDKLRSGFRATDPMNIDSFILHNIQRGTPFDDVPLVQITWAAFQAPGPIWARDFVWLQYVTSTKDEKGRDVAICACESIDRADCPNFEKKCSFVRGKICTTGYIYTETDVPGEIQVTYVVQVDPAGSLPKWLVNLTAIEQGENAGRVRDSTEEQCGITAKFNHYMQNNSGCPRGKPLLNVELEDVLVYAGMTEKKDFTADKNGVLEVHMHPMKEHSISFRAGEGEWKEYKNDPESDCAPLYERQVEKGEVVMLEWKNKTTGFTAPKFKQVQLHLRVRGEDGGRGVVVEEKKKKTWSMKSPWKKKKQQQEASAAVRVQVKEVVKEVVVHLEQGEEKKAWRKGFMTALSFMLVAVLVKVAVEARLASAAIE